MITGPLPGYLKGEKEEGGHHVLELSNQSPGKKLDDRHFPFGIEEYALLCQAAHHRRWCPKTIIYIYIELTATNSIRVKEYYFIKYLLP